jgi:hypothetical protein
MLGQPRPQRTMRINPTVRRPPSSHQVTAVRRTERGSTASHSAVLSEIRTMCRELLTGFDESMSYGMPAYGRDGIAEIAWASQKQYISLYVLRGDVLRRSS